LLISEQRAEDLLRLAGALGWFWTRGVVAVTEAVRWLEQAWACREQASAASRGKVARALGTMRWAQGENEAAKALCLESVEIFRRLGDQEQTRRALYLAAATAIGSGDLPEARRLATEQLELARRLDNKWGIQWGLSELGDIAHAEGDLLEAQERFSESLVVARETRDKDAELTELGNLAGIALDRKEWAEARATFEKTIAFWQEANDEWFLATDLAGFAAVLHGEGQPASSAKLLGFVCAVCHRVGVRLQRNEQASYDATAAAVKGELGEAVYQAAFEEGRALTQEQAVALALKTPA